LREVPLIPYKSDATPVTRFNSNEYQRTEEKMNYGNEYDIFAQQNKYTMFGNKPLVL